MPQRGKPLHVTPESGPQECSHSAGAGRHRAQDPGSFPTSGCAHQRYRGPCVCKSFVLFYSPEKKKALNGVEFNVIRGTMVDEVRGRAAGNHIKETPLALRLFSNYFLKNVLQRNVRLKKM